LDWAKGAIPHGFDKGARETFEKYKEALTDVALVSSSSKVAMDLVENAAGTLTDANRFIGRRIKDEIRTTTMQSVTGTMLTGGTAVQVKKDLVAAFTRKGVVSILDKRGNPIDMESYANMISRTTIREATNVGTMEEVKEAGGDYVQFTTHSGACPICMIYEGRVYSISGKSEHYPKLTEVFPSGYATIHPNCGHSLTPYFPEFDKDAEATKKNSNRPFELTKEQKERSVAYRAEKAKEYARTKLKKEWTAAKALAPDAVPKTFSGYAALKRAGGPKFETLKKTIRRAGN